MRRTGGTVGMVADPDIIDAVDAPLDLGVEAGHRRRLPVSPALERRVWRHGVKVGTAYHCTHRSRLRISDQCNVWTQAKTSSNGRILQSAVLKLVPCLQ